MSTYTPVTDFYVNTAGTRLNIHNLPAYAPGDFPEIIPQEPHELVGGEQQGWLTPHRAFWATVCCVVILAVLAGAMLLNAAGTQPWMPDIPFVGGIGEAPKADTALGGRPTQPGQPAMSNSTDPGNVAATTLPATPQALITAQPAPTPGVTATPSAPPPTGTPATPTDDPTNVVDLVPTTAPTNEPSSEPTKPAPIDTPDPTSSDLPDASADEPVLLDTDSDVEVTLDLASKEDPSPVPSSPSDSPTP